MGFTEQKPLRESVTAGEMHAARWGSFEVDPLAQKLSPKRASYGGLALFDPAATPSQRKRVKFRLMLKGPSRTAYGFACISLALVLAIAMFPFSLAVKVVLGLIIGAAAWRVLSVVSVRISAQAWEESVLWWPDVAVPGRPTPPPLETVLDALAELDKTPRDEITAEDYRRRWKAIYDHATTLKQELS